MTVSKLGPPVTNKWVHTNISLGTTDWARFPDSTGNPKTDHHTLSLPPLELHLSSRSFPRWAEKGYK
eukprot:6394564-Heterocapsa_arctica.AAC.1